MIDREKLFLEKTNKTETGCWEWTATRNMRGGFGGYGMFWDGRTMVYAHRWAYGHWVGSADGLDVDHLCRNRGCVNPQHLEAVDHRENILRGEGLAAEAARRDHCVHGHAYTPRNTYIRKHPDGRFKQRICRACKRESYHRQKVMA
jgi:hypothetical protein